MSDRLHVSVSLYVSVFFCVCLHVSVCVCVYLFVCRSLCESLCLSVYFSVCLYVCVCMFLFVFLCLYESVSAHTCMWWGGRDEGVRNAFESSLGSLREGGSQHRWPNFSHQKPPLKLQTTYLAAPVAVACVSSKEQGNSVWLRGVGKSREEPEW